MQQQCKGLAITILRNIWLNDLRHQRAAPNFAELDSDENLADISIAPHGDPHSVYVDKLQLQKVRAAIHERSTESREIVILASMKTFPIKRLPRF